ncbi:hypothetical protein GGF39_002018 [Coemansia sp. RSA 1721]|nr:hypothetical protein GGF39_002018 [Coemansia sp. RSA 1721]
MKSFFNTQCTIFRSSNDGNDDITDEEIAAQIVPIPIHSGTQRGTSGDESLEGETLQGDS